MQLRLANAWAQGWEKPSKHRPSGRQESHGHEASRERRAKGKEGLGVPRKVEEAKKAKFIRQLVLNTI